MESVKKGHEMKTLVTVLMIVLLMTAVGCNDNRRITAWGLKAPDSDVNLRVGTALGEARNAEVCVEIGYNSSSMNDDGTPDRIGGVFIYHLTQEVRWDDTPDPSPFAGILEALQARPFVGIGCMMDRGDQRLEGKWLVGTTFADHPDRPWAIVVEYQDGDGLVTARDDSAVFFGARLTF